MRGLKYRLITKPLGVYFFVSSYCVKAQNISRLDDSVITSLKLTQSIEDLMKKGKVHGLAISIVTKDSVLFKRAFGTKNINKSEPLSTLNGFYGASLSKPVFSYIVMKLVDNGIINLDKPLEEYLDKPLTDYAFKESYEGYQDLKTDLRYKKITARMCLSHSSGLPNWRFIGKFGINFNKKLEIEFEPGTRYSYSGEGIFLLQFVIEQITGRNLEDLAQENVFKPLDIRMTSYVWQERF